MKNKIFYYGISIFIFLLLIVFEIYYPIPKDILFYVANILSGLALCIVYLIFGLKLSKIFKIENKEYRYIYGILLSITIIGTLIFIMGFFRIFNFYSFYFLTAILILFSIKELKDFFKDCGYLLLKFNALIDFNLKNIIFIVISGFLILYSFLCILTPPVYYDELVYHLGLSSQYLVEGGIYNVKNNIFSSFPSLMQMNYIYFYNFAGDLGLKIFQFLIYITTLFYISNIIKIIDSSFKWVLLLILSFPLFILNSVRITADLPATIFIIAVLNYILQKNVKYEIKDIAITGILIGAILSIKYTGFVFYFFTFFYFLYILLNKRMSLKSFVLSITIPFFILLPYLIKNYFFTGNPVCPFFSGIFNTGILKEEAGYYILHLNNFGIEKNIVNFLLSPFYIVFKRVDFGGDILTPVITIAFISVFFTFKGKIRLLWLFILFYYVIWFSTSQVLRFLLPVCVLLIIISGKIIKNYNSNLLKFLFIILILIQIFTSFYFLERYLSPFELFVNRRDDYIAKKISYYKAAQYLNKNSIDKSAALLLGDARVFYYKIKIFTNTVFNKNYFVDVFKDHDEKKFISLLQENSIKYIIINLSELERLKTAGFAEIYNMANSQKFKKFIDNQAEKIYSDNDCVIYQLKS